MTETDSPPQPPAQLPPNIVMLQMLAGFQVSQALYVVAKLDIPTILVAKGPRTIEELADEAGAHADALGRVIRFLASLGVFRTSGELIEVTELGTVLAENPLSMKYPAFHWMETHYAPFGDLLHTVRTGEVAAARYYGKPFFDWIGEDPERVDVQNRCMAAATTSLRQGMFDGYRLPAGAVVADVGGADGAMMVQLLTDDDPERQGIVFDRPEVVAAATKTIADHGLANRLRATAGDFFDAVPAADVYVLSYILHDWNDESCRRILGSIAKAAKPGARVVVVESIMPTGDEPHPMKVIDLTMLVLHTGRERTEDEFRALLDSGGFTLDRIVRNSSPYCFIEATLR
jgi:hypothetical protein